MLTASKENQNVKVVNLGKEDVSLKEALERFHKKVDDAMIILRKLNEDFEEANSKLEKLGFKIEGEIHIAKSD